MRPPLLAAALAGALCASLVASTAFARHDHHREDGPPVAVARGEWLSDVNALLAEVAEMDAKLDHGAGKHGRRALREELDEMRERLQDMREDLNEAPVIRPGEMPPPYLPPPPTGPVSMSPERFTQVLAAIQGAYYTSEKYVVLQDAARENWFSVDQVIAVMNEMYWTSDKVKAAALLYPRVVDRGEWFRVYAVLPFDSDRQQLRNQIGVAEPRQPKVR